MEQQKFVRKNMAVLDAQRRHENKHKRRTVIYIILFVLISIAFIAVSVFVFLKVKSIEVTGSEKYSYEEIMELVPITEGENIYSFNKKKIEEVLMRDLPYVGKAVIKRDLPTKVIINITEEEPVYAANIAGDVYILSADMKVLERLPESEKPDEALATLNLSNVKRCIVGSQLEFSDSRTLDSILLLYQTFSDNYIENKIKGVDIRSRFDMYINYDDRFEVYIGDIENVDMKIEFLIGILEKLEPDSKGKIDISNHQEASVALS